MPTAQCKKPCKPGGQVSAKDNPWWVDRVGDDSWNFGLLLSTGQLLQCDYLIATRTDPSKNRWVDVQLLEAKDEHHVKHLVACGLVACPTKIVSAPCGKKTVSINLAHVVGVFELAHS